jgi:PAS domain S-box-containing protein
MVVAQGPMPDGSALFEPPVTSAKPGRLEKAGAVVVVAASVVTLAALAPFARTPLGRIDAFTPVYESALVIVNFITAVLVLGHFARVRTAAVLALACAYLFDALIIIPHFLTFPGVFSATGLFGAGSQTAVWLYLFWHGGFSLLVIAYALFSRRRGAAFASTGSVRSAIAISALGTAAVVVAMTLLAINSDRLLPVVMHGSEYSVAVTSVGGPVSALISLFTLTLLWRRRNESTLDLWLLIVMCAWTCDFVLNAIAGAHRFDLGWYAGRSFGLLASSVLLVILLSGFIRTQALLERRSAELQANEARLRAIFETTHLYQGLLSRDGRLIYANTTSLKGVDTTLEAVVGKPFWTLPWFTGTPGLPKIIEDAVGAVANGETMRREVQVNLPIGVRWFEFAIRPIFNDDGDVVAMVPEAADVTERRQAEETLRQSQKIEAIGQLTGGVAHDFNNLLMVIAGGLSIMDRQADPMRRQRILDSMRQATDRGASLCRQLLAFSRRQPLKAEPVDLRRQIDGMQELLDRALRGDVGVQTDLAKDLWPTMVDPTELELALLNLCVNARDAMPDGGMITIGAHNASGIEVHGRTGDFVRLSVHDSGVGMSPEVLERVFEPFYTTKGAGGGSGLGLAQVHGFAHQSGGLVEVASEVGLGTKVTLLLPRAEAAPLPAETARAGEEARRLAPGVSGTVLLVEDDDEVAALVSEMLRELGFEVTRTASARAALGALADGRDIDLVFSDIMMPGAMNGVDLAVEVRRRRPGLPILLTSGYAEPAIEASDTRDIGLLPKPYDIGGLDKAIRKAITRH